MHGLVVGGKPGLRSLRDAVDVLEGSPGPARARPRPLRPRCRAAPRAASAKPPASRCAARWRPHTRVARRRWRSARIRSCWRAARALAAGPIGGIDALTPTELRVAAMAASGLSNREIAQDLFVSLKTVETHLGRAYRKLDVRSRTELPRALGASPRVAEKIRGNLRVEPGRERHAGGDLLRDVRIPRGDPAGGGRQGDPITGLLRDRTGQTHPFEGWVQLMTEVDRARSQTSEPSRAQYEEARMSRRLRRAQRSRRIVVCLALAPAAQASTEFTFGSGKVPDIAVDSAGTAHVAWHDTSRPVGAGRGAVLPDPARGAGLLEHADALHGGHRRAAARALAGSGPGRRRPGRRRVHAALVLHPRQAVDQRRGHLPADEDGGGSDGAVRDALRARPSRGRPPGTISWVNNGNPDVQFTNASLTGAAETGLRQPRERRGRRRRQPRPLRRHAGGGLDSRQRMGAALAGVRRLRRHQLRGQLDRHPGDRAERCVRRRPRQRAQRAVPPLRAWSAGQGAARGEEVHGQRLDRAARR